MRAQLPVVEHAEGARPWAVYFCGQRALLRLDGRPCQRCQRTRATVATGRRVLCEGCADSERSPLARLAIEKRCLARIDTLIELEARRRRLVGYAVRFGDTYRRRDGLAESTASGAFAEAIRRGDLVLRLDHGRVLARQADGTLRLREDSAGLFAEADLGNSIALLGSRRAFGASFGFREATSRIELTRPPLRGRVLRRVDLTEITVAAKRAGAYRRSWLAFDSDQARDRARVERLQAEIAA